MTQRSPHELWADLHRGSEDRLKRGFSEQDVGVWQLEDDVWIVSYMDYDLGYFDLESNKVQALDNPFGPKVLGV